MNSGPHTWTLFLVCAARLTASAQALESLDLWVEKERLFSARQILLHISSPNSRDGSIIASPSTRVLDYHFHWVRDSAISMGALHKFYGSTTDKTLKSLIYEKFKAYVYFEQTIQKLPALAGLGEPKFNLDGSLYYGSWNRPQNDGPALRAAAMILFSQTLLDEGVRENNQEKINFVKTTLYNVQEPAKGVIQIDIEYTLNHWREPCFDIWEEHFGHHFVTQFAQRTALLMGAALATRLGDDSAAQSYREQAKLLNVMLDQYLNPVSRTYARSLENTPTLDASFVLAMVHLPTFSNFAKLYDTSILNTVLELEAANEKLYAINQVKNTALGWLAPAIGRYEQDQYQGGNPWVITTLGFAEFYYDLARELKASGALILDETNLKFFEHLFEAGDGAGLLMRPAPVLRLDSNLLEVVIAKLHDRGDAFMNRVRYHANPDGTLSEQIDRRTGFMISAEDLTWNYARFIFTAEAR